MRAALTDETCPWADLFAKLSPDWDSMTSVRGPLRDKETNVPFAGREVSLPIETIIKDPVSGELPAAGAWWDKFLQLLSTAD